MSEDRRLTEEDRVKIGRLLESGTPENQNLAFSLIEETAGQEDVADIFTMNVIIELICLKGAESLEAMVRAGHLIHKKCPETWRVFSEAVVDPELLTSQRCQALVSTIDFVNNRYPSKYLGMDDVSLREFTAISSTAAKILGQFSSDLRLSGLRELTDAVAEILSKHEGALFLDGLTSLSDAAAESLSKHEGKLSLYCVQHLSEAAIASLSKYPGELTTHAKIKGQIKRHVSAEKKQARKAARTGKSALTKEQTVKIRKLLRSKTADNVLTAVELVDASEATKDDISDVLSSSVVSLLVNTWDVTVWNSLAPLLHSCSSVEREFTELASKRLRQRRDGSYKQKQEAEAFVEVFYRDVTEPLVSLAPKIIGNQAGTLTLGLTELSDVAAESLSEHKGDLWLQGLTELSDAAAKHLAKKEPKIKRWEIKLDNLPQSAAKILRDAGHG